MLKWSTVIGGNFEYVRNLEYCCNYNSQSKGSRNSKYGFPTAYTNTTQHSLKLKKEKEKEKEERNLRGCRLAWQGG